MLDPLIDPVKPDRLTTVIDIGANPISVEPPYKAMLQKRLCRLIGFEPQPEGLEALNASKSDLETYFPFIVGDGKSATLKVCATPGMTSLLAPDPLALRHFAGFTEWGRVLREVPASSRTHSYINKGMIAPTLGKDPFAAINQLLEADIVYVRDFMRPERMSAEQLKHLAMVAHHCCGSFDLAANCLYHLARIGAVPSDAMQRYMAVANAPA